jgi:glycosyltransferase involved in cell wall biosynthesis
MPHPLISVIIPTHNVANEVEDCLKSVLCQTLTDLEVICIDDASTDGTLKILNSLAACDDRMTILPLAHNSGAGLARNIGLEHASGQYIAFMDGDDLYPDKSALERLHGKAIEHGVDICGGSLLTFDGTTTRPHVPLQHFTSEGLTHYRDYQYEGGFYRYIFRKEFLNRNGLRFPDYRRHQDSVFLVTAMTTATTFYAMVDHVYAYRKGHKHVSWDLPRSRDHFLGIQAILSLATRHDLAILYKSMVKNIGVSLHHRLPNTKDAAFFDGFDGVFFACLDQLKDRMPPTGISLGDKLRIRSVELAWRTRYTLWRSLARLRRQPAGSLAPPVDGGHA